MDSPQGRPLNTIPAKVRVSSNQHPLNRTVVRQAAGEQGTPAMRTSGTLRSTVNHRTSVSGIRGPLPTLSKVLSSATQLQTILEERESYNQSDGKTITQNRMSRNSLSGQGIAILGEQPKLVRSNFSDMPTVVRIEASTIGTVSRQHKLPIESQPSRLDYSRSMELSATMPLINTTEAIVASRTSVNNTQIAQPMGIAVVVPPQQVVAPSFNIPPFQPEASGRESGCCTCWRSEPVPSIYQGTPVPQLSYPNHNPPPT